MVYILTPDDEGTEVHLSVTATIDGDETTFGSATTGTVTSYHEITTCDELASMPDDGLSTDGYRLMNDIDCAETAFQPLWDSESFGEIFDGQGYTISNLTVSENEDDAVGLVSPHDGSCSMGTRWRTRNTFPPPPPRPAMKISQ